MHRESIRMARVRAHRGRARRRVGWVGTQSSLKLVALSHRKFHWKISKMSRRGVRLSRVGMAAVRVSICGLSVMISRTPPATISPEHCTSRPCWNPLSLTITWRVPADSIQRRRNLAAGRCLMIGSAARRCRRFRWIRTRSRRRGRNLPCRQIIL